MDFRDIVVIIIPEKMRSEEHTSELQSQSNIVCRLLLEKKNKHTYVGPELRPNTPVCYSATVIHIQHMALVVTIHTLDCESCTREYIPHINSASHLHTVL